jgi:hypothetical protein
VNTTFHISSFVFSTHDKWIVAYQKLTYSLCHHFSTITSIVICQVFFNTLNICSHINTFLINWRFFQLTIVMHMPKHSMGWNFSFQNTWTRSCFVFQVYGYYKVIIKILENTNKIFTLCEQYYLCIIVFSHMTNIWQLASSLQFPPFFCYDQMLFTTWFLYLIH